MKQVVKIIGMLLLGVVACGHKGEAQREMTQNAARDGFMVGTNVTQSATQNVLMVGTTTYPTIRSAIAALPSSGGTIQTPPDYSESDATMAIGSPTQFISLLAGKGTNITITGGSGTAGVQVFNGSDMICMSSTGRGCAITGAQTGTPLSLVANGGGAGGQDADDQEYFYLSHWLINCTGTVAYVNGCVDINGVFVPSEMDTVVIYNFANSIGLHLHSTAGTDGGTNVFQCRDCWINGGGSTGAQPVEIDRSDTGLVSAILFLGGAIEHAGSGYHVLQINGNGDGDKMHSITFVGTQFEGMSTNTAGEVYVEDAEAVEFINPNFSYHTASPGAPCIELAESAAGQLKGVIVENARCSVAANNPAVENDVTGYATASGNLIEPLYVYQ